MKNEGTIDRVARIVVGLAALAADCFTLGLGDGAIVAVITAVVGGVLVLTGLAGFCPAYVLLGMRTCPRKTKDG